MEEKKVEIWKEKANAEYQKVINLLIGLSSASLVIPVILLRDIYGINVKEPLYKHLNCLVWAGWSAFLVTIFSGAVFYYFSAKWMKSIYKAKLRYTDSCIERVLDWSFWICVAGYIFGLLLMLFFFVTV